MIQWNDLSCHAAAWRRPTSEGPFLRFFRRVWLVWSLILCIFTLVFPVHVVSCLPVLFVPSMHSLIFSCVSFTDRFVSGWRWMMFWKKRGALHMFDGRGEGLSQLWKTVLGIELKDAIPFKNSPDVLFFNSVFCGNAYLHSNRRGLTGTPRLCGSCHGCEDGRPKGVRGIKNIFVFGESLRSNRRHIGFRLGLPSHVPLSLKVWGLT